MKKYKEILLTQGKIALVNIEDYKYLNQWKWRALKRGNTYYAARGIRMNKKVLTIFMHHEILPSPKGMQIDHINMNGIDNKKDNLRICNKSQNGMNSRKQNNNTSGYKGVCWHKVAKKWMAHTQVNGKRIYLGYFKTKKQAALVYNEAAKKYHGEFARLNIIKS